MVHQTFVQWALYSIQICEISHQTFGPSHRKCPMIFVNTGLAVGSLARWLPLMVTHTCKLDTIFSGLYLADWKWLHPIIIDFDTLCPVEFYIQWCVALHQTHWGSYFINLIFPALEVNFLKKLPQLVALQIFQSSYISHGESLNHNTVPVFYYIIIIHVLE